MRSAGGSCDSGCSFTSQILWGINLLQIVARCFSLKQVQCLRGKGQADLELFCEFHDVDQDVVFFLQFDLEQIGLESSGRSVGFISTTSRTNKSPWSRLMTKQIFFYEY